MCELFKDQDEDDMCVLCNEKLLVMNNSWTEKVKMFCKYIIFTSFMWMA